ncbi:hypothetical protein JCM8097_004826 [Rhodosporidiobolus ruineniae]
MPPRRQSPKRARYAPPKPPRSLALYTYLYALFSFLPFFGRHLAPQLLFPLFSSQPTTTREASAVVYASLAAVFLLHHLFVGRKSGRKAGWRTLWLVVAVWRIASEGVVRFAGERLMRLGLTKGVVVGRLLLEAVPTLSTWQWVVESWSVDDNWASATWVTMLFLLSLWKPDPLARLAHVYSECSLFQTQGLVLAAVALFLPSNQPPKPSTQPHNTHPPSTRSSLTLRIWFFLAIAGFAHLVALTSTHCPSSYPYTVLDPPTFLAAPISATTSSRILHARKSLTGWIVVGEQSTPAGPGGKEMVFRYLRADHSLLGGLWVGPARKEIQKRKWPGEEVDEKEVVQRAESIYSTFILQELVRLVVPPTDLPRQKPEQGLIIGLGAGLSARALTAHGVNLTICEIDRAVYEYAHVFFGVEEPKGELVLRDAVAWVEEQQGSGKLFDYIIHDVFTGGAVPSSLFTLEFWSSLRTLLHPSGVLAVNFAGSTSSTSSKLILSTLLASFSHCRAFEDSPNAGRSGEKHGGGRGGDEDPFKNLVLFCTRSWFVPVEFREPVAGDMLPGGPSPLTRKGVFSRFKAQELDLLPFRFDSGGRTGGGAGKKDPWAEKEKERWMFRRGMEARVEREQLEEVKQHWETMGKVLPVETWARW